VFLVCKATFLELEESPQVSESDLLEVFGKVPGTRKPPSVSVRKLNSLLDAARRDA